MSYTSRTRLDLRFGKENVDAWADLNNTEDATEIAAAVDAVIAEVDSYVDSRLRDLFAVPFSAVPEEIADAATSLVGSRLYGPHRLTDASDAKATVTYHEDRAEKIIRDVRSGLIKLGIAPDVETTPEHASNS